MVKRKVEKKETGTTRASKRSKAEPEVSQPAAAAAAVAGKSGGRGKGKGKGRGKGKGHNSGGSHGNNSSSSNNAGVGGGVDALSLEKHLERQRKEFEGGNAQFWDIDALDAEKMGVPAEVNGAQANANANALSATDPAGGSGAGGKRKGGAAGGGNAKAATTRATRAAEARKRKSGAGGDGSAVKMENEEKQQSDDPAANNNNNGNNGNTRANGKSRATKASKANAGGAGEAAATSNNNNNNNSTATGKRGKKKKDNEAGATLKEKESAAAEDKKCEDECEGDDEDDEDDNEEEEEDAGAAAGGGAAAGSAAAAAAEGSSGPNAVASDASRYFVCAKKRHPQTQNAAAAAAEDPEAEVFFRVGQSVGERNRYVLLSFLGRGTFGLVFRAYDTLAKLAVALKIGAPSRGNSLSVEYDTLKRMNRIADEGFLGGGYFPRVYRKFSQTVSFRSPGRPERRLKFRFVVMELLSRFTLADVIDRCSGGMDVWRVREISRQLLLALQALHGTAHCHADVKPSNILFCRRRAGHDDREHKLSGTGAMLRVNESMPRYSPQHETVAVIGEDASGALNVTRVTLPEDAEEPDVADVMTLATDQCYVIRLIDFSNVTKEGTFSNYYMVSRAYRPPEVLLGHVVTTAMDLWAVACVMVEMFTGRILFPGTSEVDQMSRIVDTLGMPPDAMIVNSERRLNYFCWHERVGYYLYPVPSTWVLVGSRSKPGRHYYACVDDEPQPATFDRPSLPGTEIDTVRERLPLHWSVRESVSKPGLFVFVDQMRVSHSQWMPPRPRPLSSVFADRIAQDTCSHIADKQSLAFEMHEVVAKMLMMDPEDRVTCKAALNMSFFQNGYAPGTATAGL